MAVLVVQALEVVDVEDEQGEGTARIGLDLRDRLPQMAVEGLAVGQTREPVGGGGVLHLDEIPAQPRDIRRGRRELLLQHAVARLRLLGLGEQGDDRLHQVVDGGTGLQAARPVGQHAAVAGQSAPVAGDPIDESTHRLRQPARPVEHPIVEASVGEERLVDLAGPLVGERSVGREAGAEDLGELRAAVAEEGVEQFVVSGRVREVDPFHRLPGELGRQPDALGAREGLLPRIPVHHRPSPRPSPFRREP